ncbi:MAG: hypothetical protein ACK54X_05165 [Burkholderiales bacterium]
MSIVANGCTVRVVSGPENRLLGPRDGVQVTEDPVNTGHQRNLERHRGVRLYPERDVTLTVRAASPRARPESHAANARSPIADTVRCEKRVGFAPFGRPGSDPPLAPHQGEGA